MKRPMWCPDLGDVVCLATILLAMFAIGYLVQQLVEFGQ